MFRKTLRGVTHLVTRISHGDREIDDGLGKIMANQRARAAELGLGRLGSVVSRRPRQTRRDAVAPTQADCRQSDQMALAGRNLVADRGPTPGRASRLCGKPAPRGVLLEGERRRRPSSRWGQG